jgi:hypothetical protein
VVPYAVRHLDPVAAAGVWHQRGHVLLPRHRPLLPIKVRASLRTLFFPKAWTHRKGAPAPETPIQFSLTLPLTLSSLRLLSLTLSCCAFLLSWHCQLGCDLGESGGGRVLRALHPRGYLPRRQVVEKSLYIYTYTYIVYAS